MNELLSNYQNPEGTLKERKKWEPRTPLRYELMLNEPRIWDLVKERTVLDIGCNNGLFTREAMRRGAKRAVGVDYSDCIKGARALAQEEEVDAEFWQVNVESREFKNFCPLFDVVFFFSVLTHLKDREGFLDWLDLHTRYALVFESNHGESNKEHIHLIRDHMYFEHSDYIGKTDIDRKPHYLWVLKRAPTYTKYPDLANIPIEFVPLEEITGMDEKTVLDQKNKYTVGSEKYEMLETNIRTYGIRDPLIVKKRNNPGYAIFQGGHRYLAAKALGYKDIPCKVIRHQ